MTSWGRSGWPVEPGAGRKVELPGPHRLEVLLPGSDVDDAMGVFVFTHAPIAVNPPHAHLGYMKIIYVLDGTYEMRVGDAELRHQRYASVRLHRADRAEGMTQQPLPARPAAALTEGGGR